MPVYFIRHGQSEFNAVFDPQVGDPLIFDAPLSPLGHRQAREAKKSVAALGIERVIVSPLTRAIETALHMFGGVAAIEVDTRARELLSNSCDVGRSPAELARSFPQLSFDHIADEWWHQGPANEHGVPHEPLDVFSRRVDEFRRWFAVHPIENLAIVGRSNVFKAMIGRKLENCEIHAFEDQGQEAFLWER